MDIVPALVAEHLTKRYRAGRPAALDDVDLSIATGAVVAFVGPNGAGKSTLIRTFLGFERPTRGRVTVGGIDPRRDRVGALARIGYVGQTPGLYRDLSPADHVALARSLRRGFDADAALHRLDDLGIDRRAQAGDLSGGQQAQLALSLALGTHAPVLLLDEPLASLDPLARRDFLAMVRGAARDGATVLFASHMVGELEAVCERLVVIAAGRLIYVADIADARAGHALVPLEAVGAADVIGVFDDHVGRPRALVRVPSAPEAAPSLDDVVLGYLAGARRPTARDGAAA